MVNQSAASHPALRSFFRPKTVAVILLITVVGYALTSLWIHELGVQADSIRRDVDATGPKIAVNIFACAFAWYTDRPRTAVAEVIDLWSKILGRKRKMEQLNGIQSQIKTGTILQTIFAVTSGLTVASLVAMHFNLSRKPTGR